jgi:nucleoside-diphosphate-sugar epimerase
MSTLVVLGAGGFIGGEVVTEAVAAGYQVVAVARSEAAARRCAERGARVVRADVADPSAWVGHAAGTAAVVDLVQPALPARITRRAIGRVAADRLRLTRPLLAALAGLPAADRPLLVSVSGADDLRPDADDVISHRSPLRTTPVGFAHIGLAVRRLVAAAPGPAVHLYLGNLVYGPGKAFADTLVPGLARGRLPVFGGGRNRLPLVHVADAARAVVHLVGRGRVEVAGGTYVVADEARTTWREFLHATAALVGGPPPRALPRWVGAAALGPVLMRTLSLDAVPDISALRATGFVLRYPSYREGLEATLAALGHGRPTVDGT